MSKNKEAKSQVVSEVKEDLVNASCIIVTDYRGLNVEQMTKLRSALHAEKVKYMVVKNTLAEIAAREAGMEDLKTYLEGPTAIAYGFDDPTVPARVMTKFAKEFDKLELKGGMMDGRLLDLAQIKALSDLPSREVLLGTVAGALAAPMTGFAGALQGVLRKFVYALNAVREQKEAAQN